MNNSQIRVPSLVRIKPGALPRLGIYLSRSAFTHVLVVSGQLPEAVTQAAREGLESNHIHTGPWVEVDDNSFENVVELFALLPKKTMAIVGLGGGKALDMAKYLAFLARLPYLAVPTSLSNDGFCSPQSSLTMHGKRRSLAATLPQGVIIDVDVCLSAPRALWLSGVGDLVAKLTAVHDWKLSFHNTGEPVNDLAALLSDATVHQFLANPTHDAAGMALLGTALMLNGIAMEICGSSRPTSGSEHLISHALDATSAHPRLHGLQVGMASYFVSQFQERNTELLAHVFTKTGFWDAVRAAPFSRQEWLHALSLAPDMKENFFTVLSLRDWLPEAIRILDNDPLLRGCFI
ncbi:iron-containing alcohol dehydrogenase family protein [Desulfovibrio sp. 86]|uniref:Putative Dehydrogenase n=1 Tax=uncultured Desulfovibrio sp. TaxID=167968 RepID=A0A212LAZ9_9BACT|nr:iron-containing alcohol dehydrogenase family protein [Desulfovibrio sp. 86]SCM74657.1 putative Dehydrogenase [uncultured Desulfovibrio sp.]VZH34968.1 putative Dehydrogenase [Desulfovibrio sp. 86]